MGWIEMIIIRFIPTYMGNATTNGIVSLWPSVHPHVHGERYVCRWLDDFNNGSSPRTWGTLTVLRTKNDRTRFIPTYMGNAIQHYR